MSGVRIRELALIAVAGGLLVFEVMGFRGALPAASAASAAMVRGASHAATRAAVGVAKGTASWLGTSRPARRLASRDDIPMLAASGDRRRSTRPRARYIVATCSTTCPVAAAIGALSFKRGVRNRYTCVVKQGAL